ncbi:MAG: segregation/condensation protein A [Hydrogenothermaceae bacterium]|nr:segregation/condensation protein A [Hydrogenothermaceae bacterium]
MEERSPIDIVLKLVAEGEIDPWNIDITVLADKFIQEIKGMHIPDLKYGSKIILVASTLLKMKSESLKINQEEKGKKVSRKRIFGIKRFYTLQEIAYLLKEIVQEPLKVVEKVKSQVKERDKKSKRKQNKNTTFRLVKGGLENTLTYLEEEMKYVIGLISFNQLTYPYKPQMFMAILFLNYENKINLYQERHFDDIYIEPILEDSHML